MDTDPDGAARPLHLFVDGGYTNGTVLKKLPPRTVLVGRIRKDAKLCFLPVNSKTAPGRGRPRRYGQPAPTPEQFQNDESVPWQTISIYIAGVPHSMRVKVCRNLMWRTAGLAHILQLVVVAPLRYQLRNGSRSMYRHPAFLICTDPQMDLLALLQGYVQRWDIEVNFREEKTLLGVGQCQVRHPVSVDSVPALQVASYAMLLLAMNRLAKDSPDSEFLPSPKWAAPKSTHRLSTQRAINLLRAEVWGRALGLTNSSDFVSSTPPTPNPEKLLPHLPSAVCYAIN